VFKAFVCTVKLFVKGSYTATTSTLKSTCLILETWLYCMMHLLTFANSHEYIFVVSLLSFSKHCTTELVLALISLIISYLFIGPLCLSYELAHNYFIFMICLSRYCVYIFILELIILILAYVICKHFPSCLFKTL
jgi:hypothetical protein